MFSTRSTIFHGQPAESLARAPPNKPPRVLPGSSRLAVYADDSMWEINHPRNHFRRTLEARLTARRVEIPRDDGALVVRSAVVMDRRRARTMYVHMCVCVYANELIFRNVIPLHKADLDPDQQSVSLIFPIRSTRPQTHNSHLYYNGFAFKGPKSN